MPVHICLLRGINVGGNSIIKMDALRGLFAGLKFDPVQTYVQSGNVVFTARSATQEAIAKQIRQAIEKRFQCTPDVMLRSANDFRAVVKNNPFAKRTDIEPGKLLVSFLSSTPPAAAADALQTFYGGPEELHLRGREIYIHFPFGAGKSKLPWSRLEKVIGCSGTARNWNSVTRILAMAEAMEVAANG